MGDDGKYRFLLPQKCAHPVSILRMDLYPVKIVQGARIKISVERHLVRIVLLIRTALLAVMKQLTVLVSIFIILRTYEKQYGSFGCTDCLHETTSNAGSNVESDCYGECFREACD